MIDKSHFQPTAWYIGRLESNDGELMYKTFEITSILSTKKFWGRKGYNVTFLLEKPFFDEEKCKEAAKYLAKEEEMQAYRRLMKDVFPELENDEQKIKSQDYE